MEKKPACQHDSIIVFIININADHSWFEMTRKILVEGGTNRKELVPLKQVVKLRRDLSANDTSRHPKLLKIGPNHQCQ